MKPLKAFLIYILFFPCIIFSNSCSNAETKNNSSTDIVLVGSTPGDGSIKSLLGIHPEIKVDFIRWELTLNNNKSNQNIFKLNIVYGEAQPNTLGFIGGGKKLSLEGEYRVSQNKVENIKGEIYHFTSNKPPTVVSMVKLNDNLFHLLTPQNQLMVGNGGWSFTLNRKQPISNNSNVLPVVTISSSLPDDTARQVIFEGRTPCLHDFVKENNWTVSPDCFKLKWKLTLNRDPESLLPTTYVLSSTVFRVINNKLGEIGGQWTMIKGTPSNPNAIMYQLDPDKPEKSIFLLVGDENVIFFLNKDKQMYTGNSDFSFTLNKRM